MYEVLFPLFSTNKIMKASDTGFLAEAKPDSGAGLRNGLWSA